MLPKKTFALAVSPEGDRCFQDLKAILKKQHIEVYGAESCEAVGRLLDQTHPELIFTPKLLCDGTWRDIIHLSERVSVPINVIVVAQNKDVRFYLSAMDYGAFDFILPPFENEAVAHVVRTAVENVLRKRKTQAIKAVA